MKTPEQMAEEYANSTDSCDVDQEYAFAYKGFLAGYQAAQLESIRPKTDIVGDALNSSAACHAVALLADSSKVMNSSNNSNGWISVKERLPEVGQRVLIYNPLEYVSIVMANYYNTTRPFFDHITLDDIHLSIYPDEDKQLYWMPLPKLPEDK